MEINVPYSWIHDHHGWPGQTGISLFYYVWVFMTKCPMVVDPKWDGGTYTLSLQSSLLLQSWSDVKFFSKLLIDYKICDMISVDNIGRLIATNTVSNDNIWCRYYIDRLFKLVIDWYRSNLDTTDTKINRLQSVISFIYSIFSFR